MSGATTRSALLSLHSAAWLSSGGQGHCEIFHAQQTGGLSVKQTELTTLRAAGCTAVTGEMALTLTGKPASVTKLGTG